MHLCTSWRSRCKPAPSLEHRPSDIYYVIGGTSPGTRSLRNRVEPTGWGRTQAQVMDSGETAGPIRETMDIFEGTEQIQQLVISRAISGLRIE